MHYTIYMMVTKLVHPRSVLHYLHIGDPYGSPEERAIKAIKTKNKKGPTPWRSNSEGRLAA
jgi:hypothetical protein